MLGRFSEESLRAFAEFNNLNTGNQDFSEGIFDFKVCQKPDGKNYGIPDQDKCKAPAKEVKTRPDTGFLNTQAGKGINYDTAKSQGDSKTTDREYAKRLDSADTSKKGWYSDFPPEELAKLNLKSFTLGQVKKAYYAAQDWGGRTTSPEQDKINDLNQKKFMSAMHDKQVEYDNRPKVKAEKAQIDKKLKADEDKKMKGATNQLSSESGVKGGAALGALEELEGLRNKLVTRLLERNKSGPEVSRQVKARFEPEVRQMMQSVGASASDTENAIRYVNKGIDANLDFSENTKPGLYANIHAKRERIKAGSGEKMAKKGDPDRPSAGDFKAAAKTAKQDFSEGVFDFGFCKRPDGTRYGIADNSKCQPPNKPTNVHIFDLLSENVPNRLTKKEQQEEDSRPAREAKAKRLKAAKAKKLEAAKKAANTPEGKAKAKSIPPVANKDKAAAAPKKKVYSAEDTEYMYKKYMTMAKNEGQGSLEAGSSARRMLEAAGMDPTAMDGMARRNVRIEVFGK